MKTADAVINPSFDITYPCLKMDPAFWDCIANEAQFQRVFKVMKGSAEITKEQMNQEKAQSGVQKCF